MYKKTLRRDDWSRLLSKNVIVDDVCFNGKKGKCSLIIMNKVREPMVINNTVDDLLIAEKGYTWLQIALENEYYWLTAIYDEKGKLLSIYIDMSDGNILQDNDAYFYDIYLDYEIYKGKILTLDRNELDKAYEDGDITFEQYKRTLSEGEKLHSYLLANHEEVVSFCGKLRDRMYNGFIDEEKQ